MMIVTKHIFVFLLTFLIVNKHYFFVDNDVFSDDKVNGKV